MSDEIITACNTLSLGRANELRKKTSSSAFDISRYSVSHLSTNSRKWQQCGVRTPRLYTLRSSTVVERAPIIIKQSVRYWDKLRTTAFVDWMMSCVPASTQRRCNYRASGHHNNSMGGGFRTAKEKRVKLTHNRLPSVGTRV